MVSQQEVILTTNTERTYSNRFFWYDVATQKRDTIYFVALITNKDSLNYKPHLEAQAVMTAHYPVLYLGVTVSVAGTSGGTVNAWSVYQKSFRSFQQAGFYDGDWVMSVNELGGTAKRNITVGAYISKTILTLWNGQPYGADDFGYHGLTHYTGRGPTVDGRIKPDIMAPGSEVVGAMPRNYPLTDTGALVFWPNRPSTGGRYAFTGGTSVSAPIVAGVVALMLEVDSSLTVEQARQYIQETAITDSATRAYGLIPPYNNIWGAGKVNAMGAVAKLLGITANRRVTASQARAALYHLIRLPGNRLLLSGPARPAGAKLLFEYFSVNGRSCLRHIIDKEAAVDAFTSLSRGIYIVRVSAENRIVVCGTRITVIDTR